MNNRITKTLRAKAGFTLVELIVVIAILGILAGVGAVGYSGYIKKANEAADQQLLGFVNQAFAAACAENGDDINNVTAATLSLNGDKTVDEVSLYNKEFAKYFAGNEDSAFQVFTSIVFDKTRHLFMDAVSAGYTAHKFGDGMIYISPEDAALLAASGFIQYEGLGAEKLLERVNQVTDFAAELTENSDGTGAQLLASVFGSDEFMDYFQKALDADGTTMATKVQDMIRAISEKEGIGSKAAEAKLQANVAVLYAAQSAATMSQNEILTLLSGDDAKESIIATMTSGTDGATETAFAQATLAYGMYTAFAYSEYGTTAEQGKNAAEALLDLDNPKFKEYLADTDTVTADLQGYMSALNMINSSSGDSEAVSYLLVNGFNNDTLVGIVDTATKNS